MPFKFSARRHRIPRAQYRVQNWREYDLGLRRRGDLTLWLNEATLAPWQPPRRTTPGGQARYSDRRRPRGVPHGPLHLLIDSIGLKLFGQGGWRSTAGRAGSWRKLHLALNAAIGEIVASILSGNEADDAGQLPVTTGRSYPAAIVRGAEHGA